MLQPEGVTDLVGEGHPGVGAKDRAVVARLVEPDIAADALGVVRGIVAPGGFGSARHGKTERAVIRRALDDRREGEVRDRRIHREDRPRGALLGRIQRAERAGLIVGAVARAVEAGARWEAVGQGSGGPTDPRQEPIGVLIAGSDDGRGRWQGSAPEGSRAPTMRQAGCGSATDFMQLLQDQAVAVKSEEARPRRGVPAADGTRGLPLRLCLPCGGMLDEPLGGTPHAHAGDRYRDRLPGLHRRLRRNGADRDLLAQRLEVEARPAEILRRRKSACRRDRRPKPSKTA